MATTERNEKSDSDNKAAPKRATKPKASTAKRSAPQRASNTNRSNGSRANGSRRRSNGNGGVVANARRSIQNRVNDMPTWATTLASVAGVAVAVGGALFATRNQWMPKAKDWADDFNAAFADGESDEHNFSQTRHAGKTSMRDDPGEEWDDIDDIADASFPASDPPSYTPATAS